MYDCGSDSGDDEEGDDDDQELSGDFINNDSYTQDVNSPEAGALLYHRVNRSI
jgi:hypothetical protein